MISTPLQFSNSQILGNAWKILKEKWIFLLGVWGAIVGVSIVAILIQTAMYDQGGFLMGLSYLAVEILSLIMGMGAMKIILKVVRGEVAEMSELLSGANRLWQYILLNIVMTLVITFGLLLLIIPGIIWSIKYMFAPFLVIDEKLSFSDAMAKSDAMTRGIKWKLLGFNSMLFGLNLLGCLALFLGLVVTTPLSDLAVYVLYVKLKDQFDARIEAGKPAQTQILTEAPVTIDQKI